MLVDESHGKAEIRGPDVDRTEIKVLLDLEASPLLVEPGREFARRDPHPEGASETTTP